MREKKVTIQKNRMDKDLLCTFGDFYILFQKEDTQNSEELVQRRKAIS